MEKVNLKFPAQSRSQPKADETWVHVSSGKNKNWRIYLRDEVDKSVFNEIFKFEEYRKAKEKIKQAAMPIIDVGAHIGLFIFYCRSFNPRVKIYAFEPEKNNLEILKQNISENQLSNIEIVEAAMAEKSGQGKLILMPDNHNHFLANGNELTGEQKNQEIKTFSLADFCEQKKIKKISLLKMDIEGAEYRLINSFSSADFARVESIILEYHENKGNHHQILENHLREKGFGVQTFPSKFDKKMGFIWAVNKKFNQTL
ncbi:MAG: FkbM family methyltransferase [Patescibacteria group bacterium]|nr:FkbM family methyltransferase [Patescibacteria group bacterium]MDD5164494.1 FkbM family methyltransferase [Patescibacteria group bacterium]MDD5534144.1 FkbM family methyltransferase [Patescibacteria group bacterium]